jgi:hypothetical protein
VIAPVAELSTALLLELQRTLECCHFDVGCDELLSEIANLILGGEELIRHESRCFGKFVISESHEDTHSDGQ